VFAHPDDEVLALGGQLSRLGGIRLLHVTDGAPADLTDARANGFSRREDYAAARKRELLTAVSMAGLGLDALFAFQAMDQTAARRMPELARSLLAILHAFDISLVITHAYEGGHPDHDTCAFLTAWLSREHVLPAWELPLYHRKPDGTMEKQCFMVPEGDEVLFDATCEEVERKRRMLDEYVSQKETVDMFNPAIERFRPQPVYDFTRPPHAGPLNYEVWGWPIAGTQVVQAFQCCLRTHTESPDPKDPGSAIRGFA